MVENRNPWWNVAWAALAQQLSKRTGETLTRAVTEALRERLARVNRLRWPDTTAADLLNIGERRRLEKPAETLVPPAASMPMHRDC